MNIEEFQNLREQIRQQSECYNFVKARELLSMAFEVVRDKKEGDIYFVKSLEEVINALEIISKGGLANESIQHFREALDLLEKSRKSSKSLVLTENIVIDKSRIEAILSFLTKSEKNAIEALSEVENLLRKEPFNLTYNLSRAHLLLSLQQFGEAKISIKKSITSNFSHHRPYLFLGSLYVIEREYNKAIYFLKKALHIFPKYSLALNELGLANHFLGNLVEAESIFQKGVEDFPDSAYFHNNLGFTRFKKYFRKGGEEEVLNHFKEILEHYSRAIIKRGYEAIAHFNMGYLFYLFEKREKSLGLETSKKSEELFKRTKFYLEQENNKIGTLVSSYFIDKCTGNYQEDIQGKLVDKLLFDVTNFLTELEEIQKLKNSFLTRGNYINSELNHNHLAILKQWKPEVCPWPRELSESGGGYFIRWHGNGIVINPSHNFLINFRNEGYVISDIDTVIVTSDNPSCFLELEPLLMLVEELNEFRQEKEPQSFMSHKIKLFLNWELKKKGDSLLEKYDCLTGVVFIKYNSHYEEHYLVTPNVEIQICPTYSLISSARITEEQKSFGLILSCFENSKLDAITIGYVGETTFDENLVKHFSNCHILIIPIGRILFKELLSQSSSPNFISSLEEWLSSLPIEYLKLLGFLNFKEFKSFKEKLLTTKQPVYSFPSDHLGLSGVLQLLEKCFCKVCVLTDLTNEFGNLRNKIGETLDEYFNEIKVLTGEIGLRISLDYQLRIFCEFESRYVPREKIIEVATENPEKTIRRICHEHLNDSKFIEFIDMPRF